jgi:ferredoxin--NADP+ reductase
MVEGTALGRLESADRSVGTAGRSAGRDADPNATLVSRVDLTETVARFTLRPDLGALAFEPGQYFALGLMLDGSLVQRPYSTASGPGSGRDLKFLVRFVEGGTFTPRLWTLPVGARLRIGPPKGLFKLRPGDARAHLLVATGTGIAPLVSMLEALVVDEAAQPRNDEGPPRAVVVHGVARVVELAYRTRIEGMAGGPTRIRYSPLISRPTHPDNAGWTGLTGRIDARLDDLCDVHGLAPAESVAYLCGNPGVIAAARLILERRGFARDAIISEQYWSAEPNAQAG